MNVTRELIVICAFILMMFPSPSSYARQGTLNDIPDVVRCVVRPGTLNDGTPAMKKLIHYVSSALFQSFDNLRKVVNQWKDPGCVLDDGRPKMSALDAGLENAVSGNWDVTLNRLDKMKKRYPKSAILALADAEYWYEYAWHARGNGVASTVSPEGWKLFRQRLQTSEQVLKESKAYASDLPVWYFLMLRVEFEQGRSQETILSTFKQAVERYKLFYPNYLVMVSYILPKWGGSWQAVDNFANWSVNYTRGELGDILYARIYWDVDEDMWKNRTFFTRTRVSWKKMKASFQTILNRHPKSYWDMNYYAKFACLAGDRETFLSLRKKIGKHVAVTPWYYLPIELCEEKFAGQDRQYGQ